MLMATRWSHHVGRQRGDAVSDPVLVGIHNLKAVSGYWDGEQWTEQFAPGVPLVRPTTSAGENWFLKNKKLIATGAVMLGVLILVLSTSACGSGGGTGVNSESYFIESVKGHTDNGVSEDTAKQIGHMTCDGLNAGTPITDIVNSVASQVSGNYEWAGYVMLGGVRAYCPEHVSQM